MNHRPRPVSRRRRPLSRTLSLLLTASLLLGAASSLPSAAAPAEPSILYEDTALRGEYEKHFVCDDGSILAATYPEPVHVLTDGVWQEIDNTLALSGNRLEGGPAASRASFAQSAGASRLASLTAGDHTLSWTLEAAVPQPSGGTTPPDETEEPAQPGTSGEASEPAGSTSSLTEDPTAAETGSTTQPAVDDSQPLPTASALQDPALSTVQAQPGESGQSAALDTPAAEQAPSEEPGDMVQPDTRLQALDPDAQAQVIQAQAPADPQTNEEKMAVTKISASVLYPEALGSGVDVRYTVLPYKIKEDILLAAPGVLTSYTMRVDAVGLTPCLNPDGSVAFAEPDGDIRFLIQSPYMFDAGEGLSHDIAVTLGSDNGTVLVTYTPDAAWLNDPERVYPVTIDPTLVQADTSGKAQSAYDDTYVYENDASAPSHINEDRMWVGYKSVGGTMCIHRSYWQTAMPTLPDCSTIVSAQFIAQLTSGTTTAKPFSLFRVDTAWSGSNLKWASQPDYTLIVSGAGVHWGTVAAPNSYVTFQGTALNDTVKGWYANPSSNHGFLIAYSNEYPSPADYNVFYTSDFLQMTALAPKLVINYYTQTAASMTNGFYRIRNYKSGKYLTATSSGSVVQKDSDQNDFGQVWDLSYLTTFSGKPAYTLSTISTSRHGYLLGHNGSSYPGIPAGTYSLGDPSRTVYLGAVSGIAGVRLMPLSNTRLALSPTSSASGQALSFQPLAYTVNDMDPVSGIVKDYQSWEFIPAFPYGGASSYVQCDGSEIICLEYALQYYIDIGLTDLPEVVLGESVDTTYNRIQNYVINNLGRTCRRLQGPEDYISTDEYRIVMRTGDNYNGLSPRGEYHFLVQTNTGEWASKAGSSNSINTHFYDASQYSWSVSQPSYTFYYTSDYIYFAVQKRW